MERFLWLNNLTRTFCPPWPCPVCRKGTLRLVPKSVMAKETDASIREHSDSSWDPEWIEYSFTAWAECIHPSCKQTFAIAGMGGVANEIGPEGFEIEDYFGPLFCRPMPDIINIPKKCPDDVSTELRAAFALFWSHQAACASRIRVALEYLMNHSKIPKKQKRGRHFYFLSLHKRIDIFVKKQKTLKPQLMALKWLGNTGSHKTSVSKNDLLYAFEILESVLDEIINKKTTRITRLSKELEKKHGRK